MSSATSARSASAMVRSWMSGMAVISGEHLLRGFRQLLHFSRRECFAVESQVAQLAEEKVVRPGADSQRGVVGEIERLGFEFRRLRHEFAVDIQFQPIALS